MTYKTGVVIFLSFLPVTLSAIVHLHPIPCFSLVSGNTSPPDIDTIPCEPVNLVDRWTLPLGKIAVTDPALNLSHRYMGNVPEIYAIRLACVDQPGDFLFWLNVISKKLYLFRVLTERGF